MKRAAGLAILVLAACSDGAASRAKHAGDQLVAGLVSALEASSDNATPRLCAAWPKPSAAAGRFDLGGATAAVKGETLTVDAGDATAAIAVVADARGSAQATGRTRKLAAQFLESDVRVVVAVGGMGRSKQQLVEALAPLVARRWVLVAMPGDRESVPGLRAALSELAGRGPALDGSVIRVIAAGGALAVTLPGIGSEAGLAAGTEGCIHRPTDAVEAAARLAAHPGPRLFLSYAAPRQRGDDGSDLADGVHVGEPELADVLARSRAHLIVHGQIELGPAAVESGAVEATAEGRALAVGALERSPALLGMGGSSFAAVIAVSAKGGLRWRRARPIDN